MMTAVTYQFRGWLASMMENPRRRRTIIAAVPVLFIVAVQLPNMWNNLARARAERREARAEARRTKETLDKDLAAGRITREDTPGVVRRRRLAARTMTTRRHGWST